MNLLRRARRMLYPVNDVSTLQENRKGSETTIKISQSSLESISLQSISSQTGDFALIANNDAASTSRGSTPSTELAPSIYEDPFVSVNADGLIFVKNYSVFNRRAENHGESIMSPYVRRSSRMLKITRVRTIYFASPHECRDSQSCKPWGITCNDVWWASHLSRQNVCNRFFSVVLDDKTSLRAGFSVMCIDAFLKSLHFIGLKSDVSIIAGLPQVPISMIKIPFIDDEDSSNEFSAVAVSNM